MQSLSPRMRWLLAGLGLFLAGMVAWDVRYFAGASRPAAPPAHTTLSLPAALARPAPARTVPDGASRALPVALPAGSRNPFLTAGEQFGKSGAQTTETKGNQSTPVRLEGIAIADGARAALIGGEAVREGEWAGDIKVERIEHDRVVLARGGERWTVQLPPPGAPAPEVAR